MDFSNLITNYEEAVAVILFGIGFSNLLLQKNLIKKIIGFNIMDTAMYMFLAFKGYISGRKAPIITDGIRSMEAYINPIPSGLVLTGIVVSVSVTALMLSLRSGCTEGIIPWIWMRFPPALRRRACDAVCTEFSIY